MQHLKFCLQNFHFPSLFFLRVPEPLSNCHILKPVLVMLQTKPLTLYKKSIQFSVELQFFKIRLDLGN
ncbi:hypothetical protein I79_000650 [Cricetulus griseus]|uniref:Uncharacterized protein n=1 Tax=Cricetulus griseus TaxID=10029 RepID=G3GSN3_CRIGR|nr:hypothetical protein I79_000650 [Cricetulus griseus]